MGCARSRYVVTDTDLVVMASEVGVLPIPAERIILKGRLQPGKLFLVDTAAGRIVSDVEVKENVSRQRPYIRWVEQQQLRISDLPEAAAPVRDHESPLLARQQAFGYTTEDIDRILLPMAFDGKEPVSSMGTDIPLAVLSNRCQLLFNYFKQLFAQVTNPPIDPIREKIVMSTETLLGSETNLLTETPEHARLLRLKSPTLLDEEMDRIRTLDQPGFKTTTIPTVFDRNAGPDGLSKALERICAAAASAVTRGATIVILSDRTTGAGRVAVPALLSVSAVHHHLLRAGLRTKCGLVIETGEAREIHHFALLVGYGAAAVNPYLVFEIFRDLERNGMLADKTGEPLAAAKAIQNYCKAIDGGLLKIFSKMGISTLMSYRGAADFRGRRP